MGETLGILNDNKRIFNKVKEIKRTNLNSSFFAIVVCIFGEGGKGFLQTHLVAKANRQLNI